MHNIFFSYVFPHKLIPSNYLLLLPIVESYFYWNSFTRAHRVGNTMHTVGECSQAH